MLFVVKGKKTKKIRRQSGDYLWSNTMYKKRQSVCDLVEDCICRQDNKINNFQSW